MKLAEKPLRLLHVASEVAPYSKTGGLGDVLGALPGALSRLGFEVVVVSPLYRGPSVGIDVERHGLTRWLRTLTVPLGNDSVEVAVWEGRPPRGDKVRLFFVDHPPSFERDGLYGDQNGEFADNARRFTVLGRAAVMLAAHFELWPDVLHGHDWQAGPALLYARGTFGLPPPRSVLTIHNLAFRGIFPPSVVAELALPAELNHPDGYEFFGDVSFLKAGLVVADRITTVSPRYAEEIQTPAAGWGLDGLLRTRADRLSGILNGVDYDLWSPERDPLIAARYSHDDLAGKRACKAELQRFFGLSTAPDTPLCASVSRLTDQKGFDVVAAALPQLLASSPDEPERGALQYVVLGSGERDLEDKLRNLAEHFPKKMAVRFGYDDALAHRIEAGADLFVMPSRFEPCGLNQMYSLRYGTPPIVRAVGGLADSVVDYEPRSRSGTGFVFRDLDVDGLLWAWRRALHAYRHAHADFVALQQRGMAQDFGWHVAAERYASLYRQLSGYNRPP